MTTALQTLCKPIQTTTAITGAVSPVSARRPICARRQGGRHRRLVRFRRELI
jgi:hypothetical protein